MSRIASLSFALLALLAASLGGCSLRDIQLEGRTCPCPGTFECDPATNECVPIGTLDFTAVHEVFDFAHDSAPPPVNELVASITATGTTLSPAFDPDVTKYTLEFPISVASTTVTVMPTPAAAALGATIVIDGVSTSTSDLSLAGLASFDVTVSLGGESVTYAFDTLRSHYFKPDEAKTTPVMAGSAVALSTTSDGELLFVGAPNDTSIATGVNGSPDMVMAGSVIGAVWVYERPTGGSWAKTAYLKPAVSSQAYSMLFGTALAADGDLLAVGAPNEASSSSGVNSTPSYGTSVTGAVYIFARQFGVWSQTAYLKASSPVGNGNFGMSVALHDGTLVVGATGDNSGATGPNGNQGGGNAPQSGAAYVFQMGITPSDWTQTAYMKASNTRSYADFGSAVAVDSSFIAVAADFENSASTGVNGDQGTTGTVSGAVYVFDNPPTTQLAFIKRSALAFGKFGASVALGGSTLVVGDPYDSSASNTVDGNAQDTSASYAGAGSVFVESNGAWTQQAYLKAPDATSYFFFGRAVAIVGDDLVVGSTNEASPSAGVDGPFGSGPAAGATYIFSRSNTTWAFTHRLRASDPQAADSFGSSVALSSSSVAVGAPGEEGSSTGVDGDPTLLSTVQVGAAYAFPR